jgi:hypothetical protein
MVLSLHCGPSTIVERGRRKEGYCVDNKGEKEINNSSF